MYGCMCAHGCVLLCIRKAMYLFLFIYVYTHIRKYVQPYMHTYTHTTCICMEMQTLNDSTMSQSQFEDLQPADRLLSSVTSALDALNVARASNNK